jgi:hypothetical protein
MEIVYASVNICTPSDCSTNDCADRIPNSSTCACPDCSNGSTDRFPNSITDTCTDCNTNGSTDRGTDRFPNGCTNSCADSCVDPFADRWTAARLWEHVGGNRRPVHARRRMCAEPELSAVLQ